MNSIIVDAPLILIVNHASNVDGTDQTSWPN